MKSKIVLIIISISAVVTLIAKALEIINDDYSTDKFLVCIWSLVALFYCIKANKIEER
ncbi:hypothetical protein [Pedobacter sp. B4-66]|uniref:hypothetical protein n=1 Tax=Pedobacter sp. B4-66 TaxID=2817280 RepID=UPI001BDA17DB|nr:hypothetical protein [Pedobacter sp. B4-66]